MSFPKTAFIHAGTHKTGTTSLQILLASNQEPLAKAGLYMPNAGRPRAGQYLAPGHHVLASEFLAHGTSDEFSKLIAEVRSLEPPVLLLSSEDIQLLHARPEALTMIRDDLASAGYEAKIILYLRPQHRYAESMYSERAKHGYVDRFEEYLDTILEHGAFNQSGTNLTILYDYERLVDIFSEVFGSGNLMVRAYASGSAPDFLFRDYFGAIAGTLGSFELPALSTPQPTANESLSFIQLLNAIHKAAGTSAPMPQVELSKKLPGLDSEILNARFSLLLYDDAVRFLERFGKSNASLNELFGIRIPFISFDDLSGSDAAIWQQAAIHRELLRYFADQWFR